MKRLLTIGAMAVCLLASGVVAADEHSAIMDETSRHMVAQAMLTAHFIDAALKAGMDAEQINAVLADIAANSVISEFWISDETGQIAFTNIPGTDSRSRPIPTPARRRRRSPCSCRAGGS